MNPTRKGAASAALWGLKAPRFSIACKSEMATSQSPTVRPTAFPEDMEVGKDVPGVAMMSSEIPAFTKQRSPFGVHRRRSAFAGLCERGGSLYDAICPGRF